MTLHPQSQAFVDMIAEQNPPGWEEMTPAEGREVFDGFSPMFGPTVEIARVENLIVGDQIRVRLYNDHPGTPTPVVLFFHGGGWVLGSVETHDVLCRQLASQSGCAVVSVDYGCSPENRFPGAVNECFAVADYFGRQGKQHGIDSDRMAVAGDSAGGNLAACVAVRARDEAANNAIDWSLKLQMLIYPVIEPNFETGSYREFAEGYGLTRANMQWFWQQYLGAAEVDSGATPTAADTLAGLPPAHIITAQYDVLRDEGNQYAVDLQDAGVPVTHRQYDGMLHGFVHLAGLFEVGQQATSDVAQAIAEHLQPPTSSL